MPTETKKNETDSATERGTPTESLPKYPLQQMRAAEPNPLHVQPVSCGHWIVNTNGFRRIVQNGNHIFFNNKCYVFVDTSESFSLIDASLSNRQFETIILNTPGQPIQTNSGNLFHPCITEPQQHKKHLKKQKQLILFATVVIIFFCLSFRLSNEAEAPVSPTASQTTLEHQHFLYLAKRNAKEYVDKKNNEIKNINQSNIQQPEKKQSHSSKQKVKFIKKVKNENRKELLFENGELNRFLP